MFQKLHSNSQSGFWSGVLLGGGGGGGVMKNASQENKSNVLVCYYEVLKMF